MLLSLLQKKSYSLKKKILKIFGDIEKHKYPFFFVYNPTHYKISGKDFERINKEIQPFDVLLRRFDNYLDNGFIPGFWNHAGIYFDGGVLHAVAEGVKKETLFDFMKADHICLLRPKFEYSENLLQERLNSFLGKEYDFNFDFQDNADRLSCTEVIKEAFKDYDNLIPYTELDYFFFKRQAVVPDTIFTANFEVVYDSRKDSTNAE
jgi:hypothetical protein